MRLDNGMSNEYKPLWKVVSMCIAFPLDTNQFYWYQFESKRNDRRTNGRPNGTVWRMDNLNIKSGIGYINLSNTSWF